VKVFNSIKGRLFVWIFSFISVLLIIIGVSLHFRAKKVIFASVDRSLDSKIEIVAGLLHVEDGEIEFELSEVVSGEYAIPRSGRYYKVVMDGKVFAFSPSLVGNDFDFRKNIKEVKNGGTGDTAYMSIGPGDERVRVMQHDFEFLEKPTTIYLAESIEEEISAIEGIKLYILIAIPFSILFAGFVSLWLVHQSLNPLKMFSRAVSRITHKNLNERIESGEQTRELTRLAESFNGMLDRLQKAFEVERRIISDASHELKTPLSVIRTQCEVILQKSRTEEEYIEALETIKESGSNMSKLVHNLLSLARIDSGLLEPSRFEAMSLKECIEEAVNLAKVLGEMNHINVSADIMNDITVTGSKEKLTEAFLNVIENGVRYNRDGGSVEVAAFREGQQAKIQIRDAGSGIETGDLNRIFERFYRADTSRSTEGTGLGLSIAKAIVEAHGGRIGVHSTVGKGSCFFITLPLHEDI
jgi:hypothetical protein